MISGVVQVLLWSKLELSRPGLVRNRVSDHRQGRFATHKPCSCGTQNSSGWDLSPVTAYSFSFSSSPLRLQCCPSSTGPQFLDPLANLGQELASFHWPQPQMEVLFPLIPPSASVLDAQARAWPLQVALSRLQYWQREQLLWAPRRPHDRFSVSLKHLMSR